MLKKETPYLIPSYAFGRMHGDSYRIISLIRPPINPTVIGNSATSAH